MKYFIVNYKTYTEASGPNALELTEQLASVDLPDDWKLVVCPQAADIYRIREKFSDMEIWAQHIDLIDAGPSTGWTSAETLVMAGATGTLINHSEHLLAKEDAVATIQLAKQYELKTCVAVNDTLMAEKLVDTKPDMFAFEPPELVGGGVSLMDTDPAEAAEFINAIKTSSADLCLGAGVSDTKDVTGAIELGYVGVLVASAIVKADNPALKLSKMLNI